VEKTDVNVLKVLFAFMATLLQFLFWEWSLALQILVVVVTFDVITGVLASAKTGKTNSGVGRKGLSRKVGIFVLVALATLVDRVVGSTTPLVQTATIYWYVGNEGISIMENLGKMDVPLPSPLKKALEQLQEGNRK
jgi:toxin secretion/phage lysis holin